jgi:UDP:flavonoid glycosyltransferase YjiC (YdhE family)
VLQTWKRWRDHVEALGMTFAAAPEYTPFPTTERPLQPYVAAERAAREMDGLLADFAPDAVIHDVLTIAPALAAEVRGIPVATLIPHLYPAPAPGLPPFSLGARIPRTAAGRAFWRALEPLTDRGWELGREQLNETRRRLGLAPVDGLFGTLSDDLALVATFPQLEYPRPWPAAARIVGPLLWAPPGAGETPLPPGDGPLVVIAPSTSQDPKQALVRAALAACAALGVRALAVAPRGSVPGSAVPGSAVLVEWMSYADTLPHADVVVMHGGSGTLGWALAHGCVPLIVPAAGDMAENGARVEWAGVGVRVPRRLCSPRALELAIGRALDDPSRARRARELAAWLAARDPADDAAALVEKFAG